MEIRPGKQHTPCWVPALAIGGKKKDPRVPGVVLEAAFSGEGGYMQCRVQVTVTKPGLDGNPVVSTYQFPRPIQSYKLRKRVEE